MYFDIVKRCCSNSEKVFLYSESKQLFLLKLDSTDLCILKVIIYRVLQLPQFLLLFLLFLFLLLRQSGLPLFIVVVLLKFLWCERDETKTQRLKLRASGIQSPGLPTPASMPQTFQEVFFFFFNLTEKVHVLVTAYLHSTRW